MAVLQCLAKVDLKQVRLSSKEWSTLSTTLLFDKIYISLRKKDMEIFKQMCGHEGIRGCVKELIYDASNCLPDIDLRGYCILLYEDVEWMTGCLPRDGLESPNTEINSCLRGIKDKCITASSMYESHGHDDFIMEGFRIYLAIAKYEVAMLQIGILYETLISGHNQLSALSSVELNAHFWFDTLWWAEWTLNVATLEIA